MQKVNDIHPSGSTVEDRIGMAMKMFKEIEGRAYAFMHLWSTLSKHPKWCAYLDGKQKRHSMWPQHALLPLRDLLVLSQTMRSPVVLLSSLGRLGAMPLGRLEHGVHQPTRHRSAT